MGDLWLLLSIFFAFLVFIAWLWKDKTLYGDFDPYLAYYAACGQAESLRLRVASEAREEEKKGLTLIEQTKSGLR